LLPDPGCGLHEGGNLLDRCVDRSLGGPFRGAQQGELLLAVHRVHDRAGDVVVVGARHEGFPGLGGHLTTGRLERNPGELVALLERLGDRPEDLRADQGTHGGVVEDLVGWPAGIAPGVVRRGVHAPTD
jgi:hypothetical protein